jgi:exocyst complex component 4
MKQYGSNSSSTTTAIGTRPSSSFFSPPSPDPSRSSSTNPSSSSSNPAAAGSWATDGVASLLRLSASETNTLASSVETLRDLFWTLYSKMDAVLQGFRVAYEVAGRIAEVRRLSPLFFSSTFVREEMELMRVELAVQRRDFKDATLVKTSSGNLLFSLLDVWKPVQQEVRHFSSFSSFHWPILKPLLTAGPRPATRLPRRRPERDGLVEEPDRKRERGVEVPEGEGWVEGASPAPLLSRISKMRSREYAWALPTYPSLSPSSQQIFKFSDSDLQTSSKLLKPFEDSLNSAIKLAVPGLITDGLPSTTTTSALIVASTDPSSSSGGRSSGLNGTHKALVPADAFNVSVLFGPTLAFLERVKEIMPGGLMGEDETNASTGFGGFLEEFVLRTFLPQLEEKVASVFHQAVGGAFFRSFLSLSSPF